MGANASISIDQPPTVLLHHVLRFLHRDWRARMASLRVCTGWRRALVGVDAAGSELEQFWKQMCTLAANEYPLARTHQLDARYHTSWRGMFMADLLPLLQATDATDFLEQSPLKLEVHVRFRPPGMDGDGGQTSSVVVPLHQRLQSLKAMRGNAISTSEAAHMLFGTRAADADSKWAVQFVGIDQPAAATESMSHSSSASSLHSSSCDAAADSDAVFASASASAASSAASSRAASPLDAAVFGGAEANASAAVLSVQPTSVLCMCPGTGLRQFAFDRVFNDTQDNRALYNASIDPVVTTWLNGKSCVVLAYGPTGTGKTHTVFGADETASCRVDAGVLLGAEAGLAPRACAAALAEVARRRDMHARGVLAAHEVPELWVSLVQVYGNEVTDLLAGVQHEAASRIGVWSGMAAASLAAGHAEVCVETADTLGALLLAGERAKRRAATAVNARSSRAHTLLTLRLRMPLVQGAAARTNANQPRLVIADLGGCERLKKSGAAADALRMREAININVGLLALQNCVTALVERATHVPYADSRLTALLASALHAAAGGGGRVAFVIAARTDPAHANESIRALRFGETASQAKLDDATNGARAATTDALAAIAAELLAIEAQISKIERWEKVVTTTVGEFDSHTVASYKLVGAEALRERQASLVAAQSALFGGGSGGASTMASSSAAVSAS